MTISILVDNKHQYHVSNRLKMIFMLILTIAICPINSLRLEHHDYVSVNPYNENTYASDLTSLQTRFTKDINLIKEKFTNINMELANTNITRASQITFLQQNIANERDALFNIQSYLNVPFALRSCQCVNLTQYQQTALKNQLTTISNSIQSLQNLSSKDKNGNIYNNPRCLNGNCPQVQQIRQQINQLQLYKNIINQTVSTQCCKIVNYVYRDNLIDNSNWVYGNMTQQQYRLFLFKLSNLQNITQCPSQKPFADTNNNMCVACTLQKPLFNLQNRQCQQRCEFSGLVLDKTLHICDINKTCQQGKYFDQTTKSCLKDLGTASSCPNNRPIWNNDQLQCQTCPNNQPFYDRKVKDCRQCTLNQIWQQYTSQCIDKHVLPTSCPIGYYFNTKSSLVCQRIPQSSSNSYQDYDQSQYTDPTPNNNPINNNIKQNGTFSNCPPQTPFWSSRDFACHSCPQNTPYFNASLKLCQVCPTQTTFDQSSGNCVSNNNASKTVQCRVNQIYNAQSKKCQLSSTNRVGVCPPESPNYNLDSMSCQKCNNTNPYWNTSTLKCQTCSNYTAWDDQSKTCISTLKKCKIGFRLIIATNTCQIVKCSSDTPVFNSNTDQCQKCPQVCESPFSGLASVCPKQNPYYNSLRLSCEKCPYGQTTNSTTQFCQPSNGIANHQQQVQKHEAEISYQNHLTTVKSL